MRNILIHMIIKIILGSIVLKKLYELRLKLFDRASFHRNILFAYTRIIIRIKLHAYLYIVYWLLRTQGICISLVYIDLHDSVF